MSFEFPDIEDWEWPVEMPDWPDNDRGKGGPIIFRDSYAIGGLFPDVVTKEVREDELTVTKHPLEEGYCIHDHAYRSPRKVTIQGGVSDSSIAWGWSPHKNFYEKLLELQASRKPFDILSRKGTYKNMVMTSLNVTSEDTKANNALFFTATCVELITVETQTRPIPPNNQQQNPQKTGSTAELGQQQPQRA